MKRFIFIPMTVVLLLAAAAAIAVSYYQQRQRQQEITLQTRLRSLTEENDRLAQELQMIKVLIGRDSVQRRVEKEVGQLRGLAFARRVRYKRITRQELPGYLSRELRAEYTEEEFEQYLRSLSVMGFLPEQIDLKKLLLDLLGEQIAAFYDPREGELFTFETFDINRTTDQMIYAHEVTHALQDQNFDLKDNPALTLKDNDDRVMAAKALIEGDATLLMTFYFQAHFDPVQFLTQDIFRLLGQPVEKLAKAPAYLRESLLFSYQQGQVFCMELYDRDGFEGINRAFRDLPESTEQILHPEKYLGQRDPPIEVSWKPVSIEGWKKIGDNVAGELGIRLLLADQLDPAVATAAAQGWGGDRYQVFETAPGRYSLVWWSRWDSKADAREFFNAYTSYYVKKHNLPPVEHSDDSDAVLLSFDGRRQTFMLKDGSVAILDVPSAEESETILDILWQNNAAKK